FNDKWHEHNFAFRASHAFAAERDVLNRQRNRIGQFSHARKRKSSASLLRGMDGSPSCPKSVDVSAKRPYRYLADCFAAKEKGFRHLDESPSWRKIRVAQFGYA